MNQMTTRLMAAGGMLAVMLIASSRAEAVYSYALAAQQATLKLQNPSNQVQIISSNGNSDSEAEVHNIGTDDALSQTHPANVHQSAVGFAPGAAGTHGAAPGEDTYFRPGPSTGTNWDPNSTLGNQNPGSNRSRGDAIIVNTSLLDIQTSNGVVAANVAESLLTGPQGGVVGDASGSGEWNISYEIQVLQANTILTIGVSLVNELHADVSADALAPFSNADATYSFIASLFNAAGQQLDIDTNTLGLAFNYGNTIGADPGDDFEDLVGNALDINVVLQSIGLQVGSYTLDFTASEDTFVELDVQQSQQVPEPATATLATLTLLVLTRRRCRE